MSKSEKNLDAVFQDTADAIREKTGSNELINPLDFADKVKAISTGITPTGTVNITQNGDHDVSQYETAHVSVPGPSGTKTIRSNGMQIDVASYAHVNVFVEAVTTDSSSFTHNLPYNVFGMDECMATATSCIDAEMIIEDNHKTFYCNLFGHVAAFSVINDGGLTLQFDSSWGHNEDTSSGICDVTCGCIKGISDDVDIRHVGLQLVRGEGVEPNDAIGFLNSQYPNSKIRFVDLLGNLLIEVPLVDMIEGGGS